jgi:hypothetical protein
MIVVLSRASVPPDHADYRWLGKDFVSRFAPRAGSTEGVNPSLTDPMAFGGLD